MLRTDGRTHARMDARMDGQRENSIPTTNKVCEGYNNKVWCFSNLWNTDIENFLKLVRIKHHAYCARPLSPLIEPLVFLAVIDRCTSERLEIVTDHCYRLHIYSTYQLLLQLYISFRKVFCASYKEMRDG